MVKPHKLTEKQKEALKKVGQYEIAGPGSMLSIDPKRVEKIAQKIRVQPQINDRGKAS